jgi:hypothetical protein
MKPLNWSLDTLVWSQTSLQALFFSSIVLQFYFFKWESSVNSISAKYQSTQNSRFGLAARLICMVACQVWWRRCFYPIPLPSLFGFGSNTIQHQTKQSACNAIPFHKTELHIFDSPRHWPMLETLSSFSLTEVEVVKPIEDPGHFSGPRVHESPLRNQWLLRSWWRSYIQLVVQLFLLVKRLNHHGEIPEIPEIPKNMVPWCTFEHLGATHTHTTKKIIKWPRPGVHGPHDTTYGQRWHQMWRMPEMEQWTILNI